MTLERQCSLVEWQCSHHEIARKSSASLEHATPELQLDVRIQQLGWHRGNVVHSNVKSSYKHGSDGQQI